ncbi:MAG: hypothetical protein JSS72_10715 [Armatimonadetes bacterium]|nr:hypothetical protein [Armatimonadota bacterium]
MLVVPLSIGLASAAIAQQSPVAKPTSGTPVRRLKAERHPEIRKALNNLNRAKEALSKAAHDFGGHREKALDLVEQAIKECNAALASDKK